MPAVRPSATATHAPVSGSRRGRAHMAPLVAAWLLVLGVAACASIGAPEPVGDMTISLGGDNDDGTGVVDWHAATVAPPIVMGPQGGQHIWLSLRTGHSYQAKSMRLVIDMTDLDTGEAVKPGSIPVTTTLTDVGDALQGTGLRAYVKEPCKIMGHHVRVHVSVEDLVGLTGSDEAVITPTWGGFCGT